MLVGEEEQRPADRGHATSVEPRQRSGQPVAAGLPVAEDPVVDRVGISGPGGQEGQPAPGHGDVLVPHGAWSFLQLGDGGTGEGLEQEGLGSVNRPAALDAPADDRRPRDRGVHRPRMAEHLVPRLEVAGRMEGLVGVEAHSEALPAAEMIEARVGEAIVAELHDAVDWRADQVVRERGVPGQQLRPQVHAARVGLVEGERATHELVIPPEHLKVGLDEVEQVDVARDRHGEGLGIGDIELADLPVALDVVAGSEQDLDALVLLVEAVELPAQRPVRARVVDHEDGVVGSDGAHRADGVQEVDGLLVAHHDVEHRGSRCAGRSARCVGRPVSDRHGSYRS